MDPCRTPVSLSPEHPDSSERRWCARSGPTGTRWCAWYGARPGPYDEVEWDPGRGTSTWRVWWAATPSSISPAAGVGDHRWTAAYKREIRDSRVLGTAAIAEAVASLDVPPKVLLSGSAIGYYGDTGDRAVDESAPAA